MFLTILGEYHGEGPGSIRLGSSRLGCEPDARTLQTSRKAY